MSSSPNCPVRANLQAAALTERGHFCFRSDPVSQPQNSLTHTHTHTHKHTHTHRQINYYGASRRRGHTQEPRQYSSGLFLHLSGPSPFLNWEGQGSGPGTGHGSLAPFLKRKWGQSMEPQGTRCFPASLSEREGLTIPKCFSSSGITPGSWGAQNEDPGLAGEVRQSQVRWERGSEASQVCPKSCQQAGKKRRRWRKSRRKAQRGQPTCTLGTL